MLQTIMYSDRIFSNTWTGNENKTCIWNISSEYTLNFQLFTAPGTSLSWCGCSVVWNPLVFLSWDCLFEPTWTVVILSNLKQGVQRFTAFSAKNSLHDSCLIMAEQQPAFPATVTQTSKRFTTGASYVISEVLPLHWILQTKNHAAPGSPYKFAVSPTVQESWGLSKFAFSFLTMLHLPVLWKTLQCKGMRIFNLKKEKYITHSDQACCHFGL